MCRHSRHYSKFVKFVQFVVEKNKSVVSHHPSDISHLKKSVPLSSAECITFAAVAANNVRKDSGEIRKFAYAIEQSETKKAAKRKKQECLHFSRKVLAQSGKSACTP